MNTKIRKCVERLAALAALVLVMVSGPAARAEVRSGESVFVGPQESVPEDLYLRGSNVTVDGNVDGDLIIAGGTVTVNGAVAGDLQVAGGTVQVSGPVRGSVRVAGGEITIRAPIEQDLVVAAGRVFLTPQARVGRDVLAGLGSLQIEGPVGRDVHIIGGEAVLRGQVGGGVRADVQRLRLEGGARVARDLIYASWSPAELAPGATVGGKVEQRPSEWQGRPDPLGPVYGWIRAFIGLVALGLVLVLLFPRYTERAVSTLRASPWASLGLGAATMIGAPIAAILLFMIGLLIGGWWIGLILLSIYLMVVVSSFPIAGMLVGRWLLERFGKSRAGAIGALVLGLALLLLAGVIPFLGALVLLAALLFGAGALVLAALRARRSAPAAIPPAPLPV
jgi:hypothetical protein